MKKVILELLVDETGDEDINPIKDDMQPRKKHPLPQGSSISDVCARANAAGRTYGQQVEYERRQKEMRDRGKID